MQSPPGTHDLPSALSQFDRLAQRLGGARPAVFLDYDGTLTPIVERPDLAVMGAGMKQVLGALGALCPVAIVSGRACDDVRSLVGIDNIYYAGNHGFEIEGPKGSGIREERGLEYLDDVEAVRKRLLPLVEQVEGAMVENKRFSLSLHYRLAEPGRVPDLERAVDDAIRDYPRLRKHKGKMVFEIRPRIEWDKGRAVMWLLQALGLDQPGVVPVYLGDDTTDEDAFRAVRGRGIGILVADEPRESCASFVLRDTGEVLQFMHKLVRTLECAA